MPERLLLTGAGGFIGHHLVKYLVARGYWVRGADLKQPQFEPSPAHEFEIVDLRRTEACLDTGQMVTLDQLVKIVAEIAGKTVRIRHNRSMPQRVRGCNSDNALLRHVLRWEPQISLREGLSRTYAWIARQISPPYPRTDSRPLAPALVTQRVRERLITAA